VGRYAHFNATFGTQIAGGTPDFQVGGSRVSVSNDPKDNLYGSLSLSIPFESVFGRQRVTLPRH
jgi:hypothetical protein